MQPQSNKDREEALPTGFLRGHIPAYEVATSAAARATIDSIISCETRWRDYARLSDEAAVALAVILRVYADQGTAPQRRRIADALGVGEAEAGELLRELIGQDLIVGDSSGGLVGAYPFVDRETSHHVHFTGTGKIVGSMCAVDALGAGAMLNKATKIVSECGWCRQAIRIETAEEGRRLASVNPTGTIVQVRKTPAIGCAADSLCTGIRFYCSAIHAEYARDKESSAAHLLSVSEALEVGRALFEQRALFNVGNLPPGEDFHDRG